MKNSSQRHFRRRAARLGLGLGLSFGLSLSALHAATENWPVWRGPRGDGTSLEDNVPVHWGPKSNLLWTAEIPGTGHASPVVWRDRVFTVTALPEAEERRLVCLDAATGRFRWQQQVLQAPLERRHTLNSHASSTPATDGERVYVSFLDRDQMLVAAYDLEGRELWRVRPGAFASMHGFCSSPILHRDLVILNGDHDGDSYLVALDRRTGATRWKTPRLHHTRSYCVPLIRELAGRTQMILSGDVCVTSYDPNDGKLHWIIDGPTEQFVASVVYNERADLLFITGGYPEHHLLAVRPDGLGNITRTHIVWRTNKGAAYVPSPIAADDFFLVVSDSGVAHCFEARTGTLHWQERLGEHHASLVSARGLVYFLNDDGITHVVKPGRTYELVARNELGEKCFASPAISGGRILIRGNRHLFCIGSGQPGSTGER